jgi:hypothetical protein
MYGEISLLLYYHLEPFKERFLAGDATANDEVIEFLAIDLLASGTGYQKQRYYRKLKQLGLTEEQVNRVREIALVRCASDEYRREDSLAAPSDGSVGRCGIRRASRGNSSAIGIVGFRAQGQNVRRNSRPSKRLSDQLKTKQGSET